MAVVLRGIWLRGNVFVFENKFEGPDGIFIQAAASLVEFQQAQQKKDKDQENRA